jgi:hypothetical protein
MHKTAIPNKTSFFPKNSFFQNFFNETLSKEENLTSSDTNIFLVCLKRHNIKEICISDILENRDFYKNTNTKFQDFERIQSTRNNLEFDAYCKPTNLFLGNTHYTAITNEREFISAKLLFPKFPENETI